MQFSPFCTDLQRWILKERTGSTTEMDVEDMLILCLRKIVELETQIEKHKNPDSFSKRKILPSKSNSNGR